MTAIGTNMIIYMVIGLFVLAIMIWAPGNTLFAADKVTSKCEGLRANSLYVPNQCDTDISAHSPLGGNVEHNGQTYVCCTPLAGEDEAFEEKYGQYASLEINKGSSVANTPSPTLFPDPKNRKINFWIDTTQSSKVTDNEYTSSTSASHTVQAADTHDYSVKHDSTSSARCVSRIGPAIIEQSGGKDVVAIDTSALVDSYDGPCTDAEIILEDIQLQTLSGAPEFYKWDFSIYDTQGGAVSASAMTYVAVQ